MNAAEHQQTAALNAVGRMEGRTSACTKRTPIIAVVLIGVTRQIL